jgi:hypothetical protein
MKADRYRKPGFYWVKFEGERLIAEWTDGLGCEGNDGKKHWHVPGSDGCFYDREVCELIADPLLVPAATVTAHDQRASNQSGMNNSEKVICAFMLDILCVHEQENISRLGMLARSHERIRQSSESSQIIACARRLIDQFAAEVRPPINADPS